MALLFIRRNVENKTSALKQILKSSQNRYFQEKIYFGYDCDISNNINYKKIKN